MTLVLTKATQLNCDRHSGAQGQRQRNFSISTPAHPHLHRNIEMSSGINVISHTQIVFT